MDKDDYLTTITIQKSTRDRLASFGNKDDSFELILRRLIEFWISEHKVEENNKR